MKRLFLTFMAAACVMLCNSCSNKIGTKEKFPEIWKPGVFNLEAHRGFSDEYPENTELAFRKAVEAGSVYRGMETDVQMTKDSVLVCMHDNTLKRTTGAPGTVADYTFEELEMLDAGQGEKVPLLATYLDICREGGMIPYVELKSVLADEGIPKTIDLIHEKGFKDGQFVITSFSAHHLEIASTLCDTPMEYMAGSFRVSYLDSLPDIRNIVIRPQSSKLTDEFVEACRGRDIPLECYGLPVGDKDLYDRLVDWGVLGVTCNSYIFNKKEDKDNIMSEAYWKLWNPQVQAKIDADIEANRKADAVLELDVPAGTEVTIEQVSHDFIFGAHIFNFNQLGTHERNERYKELYGTLFNSATIAFYWKTFEMEPDRLRFETEYWDTEEFWNNCKDPKNQPHWRRPSTDQVVDFCESKGIRLHGHTMIWGNRTWQHPHWIIEKKMTPEEKAKMDTYVSEYINPNNNQAIERYTETYKALTEDQLSNALPEYTKTVNELFEKRITDLAKRYSNRIDSWDVVNESSVDFKKMNPGGRLIKSEYGIMPADYTFKAFQTAKKVFPDRVKLNINDYNLKQDYLDQIKDLTDRGCKIDIVGSQMHLFNPQQCLDIADGKEIQTPEQVWGWAKLLEQAGKPIHLSEITITAPGNDTRGRQIQAIIAQNLYRLWFSIKPMMGITWWNVVDDCGAPGEPSVSGLFDRDMKPKASYYALENLINHEWKTKLTVKTGKKGVIRFRGFKGGYKATWKDADGNQVTREFHLSDDGINP